MHRAFLVTDHPGPAPSARFADLLEGAAVTRRSRGQLTVHHVAVETTDDFSATGPSLTVCYDRVERRHHDRD